MARWGPALIVRVDSGSALLQVCCWLRLLRGSSFHSTSCLSAIQWKSQSCDQPAFPSCKKKPFRKCAGVGTVVRAPRVMKEGLERLLNLSSCHTHVSTVPEQMNSVLLGRKRSEPCEILSGQTDSQPHCIAQIPGVQSLPVRVLSRLLSERQLFLDLSFIVFISKKLFPLVNVKIATQTPHRNKVRLNFRYVWAMLCWEPHIWVIYSLCLCTPPPLTRALPQSENTPVTADKGASPNPKKLLRKRGKAAAVGIPGLWSSGYIWSCAVFEDVTGQRPERKRVEEHAVALMLSTVCLHAS